MPGVCVSVCQPLGIRAGRLVNVGSIQRQPHEVSSTLQFHHPCRFAEAETSLSSSEALAVSAVDAEIGRLKALLDGCRESAVGSIQALCNSQRACIALQVMQRA